MNIKLTLLEIFLLETIGWFGLWLLSNFYATLLTYIIAGIVLAVLLIALAAEAVERSKVPRRYFYVMGLSLLAPLLAAGVYKWMFG